MTVATDVISVVVATGALGVAIAGDRRAGRAVKASERANRISREANDIAAQALDWEQTREAERSRPRVRVEIEQSSARLGPFVLGLNDDARPLAIEHVLTIIVINAGEAAEGVTAVYVVPTESAATGYDLGLRTDQELEPRQRLTWDVSLAALGFDTEDGIRARIQLASGEMVESAPTDLSREIATHVASHNRNAR